MRCPLDYSLCNSTVTVYRKTAEGICRQVVEGCYLENRCEQRSELSGTRQESPFLLIMPGSCQRVFPGDRILEGIGPQVIDWESFIPVTVPGLYQAQYAMPCYWEGQICHVEAGR